MDNKKVYKGEWCISSSTPCRKERLRAHKEFEASDLKRMLDEGWEIRATKHKRPRIKKPAEPDFKIVMVFGKPVKLTIQEYKDHWTFDIQK